MLIRRQSTSIAGVLALLVMALGAVNARADISSGYNHTCSRTAAGAIWCAGANNWGQIPTGSPGTPNPTPKQQPLPAGVTATALSAGDNNTCIVGSDAQGYCVGFVFNAGTYSYSWTHDPLPGSLTVKEISSQTLAICAVASDAQVYCHGSETDGQLGNGVSSGSTLTPVRFQLPAGVYALHVYNTLGNTCVLGTDGHMYCAGKNAHGQLADGTVNSHATPVVFPLPAGVSAVSASSGYGATLCVIGNDGRAYCAGQGDSGQVGDNAYIDVYNPLPFGLPSGERAASVSTGLTTTCVTTTSGNVYCAGDNSHGQLGVGTAPAKTAVPVRYPLPGGLTAAAASEGAYHTCVQATNKAIYCSGMDDAGQLGLGSAAGTADVFTPKQFLAPLA